MQKVINQTHGKLQYPNFGTVYSHRVQVGSHHPTMPRHQSSHSQTQIFGLSKPLMAGIQIRIKLKSYSAGMQKVSTALKKKNNTAAKAVKVEGLQQK